MTRFINVVPETERYSNLIDGVPSEQVVLNGRSVQIVRASSIAVGSRWIEKTEQWAKDHHALLYDMDTSDWNNWTEAAHRAQEKGYDIVVVRRFQVC
jgi:hypothetical protein